MAFWARESRKEFIQEIGKLLGVFFKAGDIRKWKDDGGSGAYQDNDDILIPLSIALRPEMREHLQKMVGGMALPDGYKKGKFEQVVDLGRLPIEDFKYFLKHRKLPDEG